MRTGNLRRGLIAGMAILVVMAAVGPVLAGQNAGYKVAVHVMVHGSRTCTKNLPVITDCSSIVETYAGGGDIDVFPVFYDLTQVTGVEYGLTWPADWGTCAYTGCTDLAIGTILNPGDVIAQTWYVCKPGTVRLPGFGWLYSASKGAVEMVPSQVTGKISTADCDDPKQADYPIGNYFAGVNGLTGEEPCAVAYLPLSLTKDDAIDATSCAFPSGNVTYTLNYGNPNTAQVTNVSLVDILPTEVIYVSSTDGGVYDSGQHKVTWTLGTLPGSATGSPTVTVQVRADATPGATVVNSASITGTETGTTDTGHNTAICACAISGPSLVCPGTTNTYSGPVGMVSYTWNISGNGFFTTSNTIRNVQVQARNDCDSTYTLTLTVNQGGGVTSVCHFVANVDDNTDPVITTWPGPVAVSCAANIPPVDLASVAASDACGTPSITHVSDVSDGNTCPEVITRTYRATDRCGNFDECVQLITIDDNTKPTFVVFPADTAVECISEVPAADTSLVDASDSCSTPIVTHEGDTPTGTCPTVIERRYRATDACGNFADSVQVITVDDDTDPAFTVFPADTTVECLSEVPAADINLVDADDNCGTPTISHEGDSPTGTCPTVIERTYRATDACGNFADSVQVITVDDTTPPSITAPSNRSFECDETIDYGVPIVSDNCDASPDTTYRDTITPGDCSHRYTITRMWTATDACGNADSSSQTIQITDDTVPQFTVLPNDTAVSCFDQVPAADIGLVAAEDACGGVVVIAHVGDSPDGTCPTVITRTYSATDICGNVVEHDQYITVDDNEAPTLDCVADKRVACGSAIVFDDPPVSDNCDDGLTPRVTSTSSLPGPGPGETTHTRCWDAIDACGNVAVECCQDIIEEACGACNISGPTQVCPGADQAFSGPAGANSYSWSRSGNGSIVPPADQISVTVHAGGECDSTFTLRLTVDFGAGPLVCYKAVMVDDNTLPVITACPADTLIECPNTVPPANTSLVSATDNCGVASIVHVGDLSDGGTCPEIITRTYRATDFCGNAVDCVQHLIVDDTTPPQFTSWPNDTTVTCVTLVPPADIGLLTADDVCSGPATIVHVGDVPSGTCPTVITRTYRATDACGNPDDYEQTITVEDNIAPTLVDCAADKRVACGAPIVFDAPSASDNCDGTPTVRVASTGSTPGPGPGETTHTRCWDAIDDCGNVAVECCQSIIEEACAVQPLSLSKNDNVSVCVNPGETFAYNIGYYNQNSVPVTSVVLVDTLPDGVNVIDAMGGTYDAGPPATITWDLVALGPGIGGTMIVTLQVDPATPYGSTLDNVAMIDCAEAGPRLAFATTDVCEYTFLALLLTKDDGVDDPVDVGQTLTYVLDYTNPNNLPVHNAVLVDDLPPQVDYVSNTGGGTYDTGAHTVTWTLGTIDDNGNDAVGIVVVVNSSAVPGGTIVNAASIVSDETGPTPTAGEVRTPVAGALAVYFDIKPGSCPNSFNPKSRGVLPAAILGSAALDVEDINVSTVRLERTGYTAEVPPLRWSFDDVATPYAGTDPCGCNSTYGDGYMDLTLKFDSERVASDLGLSGVGITVPLWITGELLNGTPFSAADCVRLVGKDGSSTSSFGLPGVGIGFAPGDVVGTTSGSRIGISFYVEKGQHVRIDVFDVHGRVVKTIADQNIDAGSHTVLWDGAAAAGERLPAGIYFARLVTATASATTKVVLVD